MVTPSLFMNYGVFFTAVPTNSYMTLHMTVTPNIWPLHPRKQCLLVHDIDKCTLVQHVHDCNVQPERRDKNIQAVSLKAGYPMSLLLRLFSTATSPQQQSAPNQPTD